MPSQSKPSSQSRNPSLRQPNFTHASPLLDATNVQILRCLQNDPRISMKELARQVGMSSPATSERLLRLQEAGIVKGARLELDSKQLGLPMTAYVRVRPMPGALSKLAELAQSTPEVVECHRITGEDCFIMKVLVAGVEELENVLNEFLVYGNTTTSIVQSSPVPLRDPPLPPR